MSSLAPKICLITPGHVASTPRIVKEADALAEAGYDVHVVSGRNFPPADAHDEGILANTRWSCTRVSSVGMASLYRKLRRKFARMLVANLPFASIRTAAYALHAESLRLGSIAARTKAKLYIGHCLPALPAAAIAARSQGSPFGFDAEDFHDAENDEVLTNQATRRAVQALQSRLLPECAHLTAASPLICKEYAKVYGVRPACVLNVFPRAQAPATIVDPGPISMARPAAVYWFSQTIGPGRGLESAVDVIARMKTPVQIQLRGFASPGYVDGLQARAARAGLARPILILPPGPPSEMARLASHADLGLSTEEKVPLNRDLCLTNKIFIYLMAGIPQLLSDTSAQAGIAPELGDSGMLSDLSDTGGTAARLDAFFGDPTRVSAARALARRLAFTRFCWEVEKSIVLDSIRSIVPLA